MTREEFFEWLNTCPTQKWEVVYDDHGFAHVSFPFTEDDEDEDEDEVKP